MHFLPQDSQQAYRIKRLLMPVTVYLIGWVIVAVANWHGFIPPHLHTVYVVWMVTANGLFYLAIRSGWNLRFADPSLTEVQMLSAYLHCSYTLIYAGQFRPVFMFIYVLTLMFGGTHLTTRRLLRIALLPIPLFPVIAILAARQTGTPVDWWVELINGSALCLSLWLTVTLVGNLAQLRLRLKASNAELQKALIRLTDLVMFDDLTQLHNRRYLINALELEHSRAERNENLKFCICLLDIDHFKRINDTYGHSGGDLVLREFGALMQNFVRNTDLIGRWGGEEFLVLLPQTSIDRAENTARRIAEALAQTRFEGLPPEMRMTVSMGIAEYRRGESIDALIDRADQALYQAKNNGRNRIERG